MIGHPEVKTVKATIQTVVNSMKNQHTDPLSTIEHLFLFIITLEYI